MRWLAVALILGCALLLTAQVSYEGQPVAYVDLVSDPRIDVEGFRSLVKQQPGHPYSEPDV